MRAARQSRKAWPLGGAPNRVPVLRVRSSRAHRARMPCRQTGEELSMSLGGALSTWPLCAFLEVTGTGMLHWLSFPA
jgi:hypothetical protein